MTQFLHDTYTQAIEMHYYKHAQFFTPGRTEIESARKY